MDQNVGSRKERTRVQLPRIQVSSGGSEVYLQFQTQKAEPTNPQSKLAIQTSYGF